MNTRHVVVLACVVIAVTGLGAVWSRHQTETVELTLVTGVQNGGFYSLGKHIAQAVHETDERIKIHVEPSDGSIDNREWLRRGDAELAIVQNDTDPQMVDLHTLIPLHRGVFHFLVHRDSKIESIYDLRSKRVGVGASESGNYHVVEVLLKHFGIGLDELSMVKENFDASALKVKEGDLDAVLVLTAINAPALVEFVQHVPLRYVSLAVDSRPGNAVDGFAVTYPYVERFTIPRFVYPLEDDRPGFPLQPCETFALRSSLVCRGDLPDAVARTIVAAIVAHRTSMMRAIKDARDITEHFDPEETQFPIHHGAMAYFQRQRPSFLERYSEPMAFILSLFIALCGLIAGFNKWIVVRKKNRIDRYYSRLDDLLTELNLQHPTAQRLQAIEQELLSVRHDAVRALVREQLLADESFQIFQSLLTDCHQQISLLRQSMREARRAVGGLRGDSGSQQS